MPELHLRSLRSDEFDAVAELVCVSTNAWYQRNRGFEIFTAGPVSCRLFPEVYEALDPGCCVVAEDARTGRLMGSCFYHPRETHVSLGIMNVHPEFSGRGVASRLLRFITDFSEREGKPTRLVSSAMNLDSFSLYSRAGFVPRATFADMQVPVAEAVKIATPDLGGRRIRPATGTDVVAIADLERELSHIRREKDYEFFVENRKGIWRTSVAENAAGGIDGFLVSVAHPGSNMLGPGVMWDEVVAAGLIADHLRHHAEAGRAPVSLIPLDRPGLVRQMYTWGAKNLEIHFAQVRGAYAPPAGVTMPTFMPETA
jgi:ribosomal protein S18 acetylase RimI-like enzyme